MGRHTQDLVGVTREKVFVCTREFLREVSYRASEVNASVSSCLSPVLPTVPTKMASPTLKDLPKVDTDLKSQLEGFTPDKLKSSTTEDKTVLPTKEDIETERTHQGIFQGIEGYDKSSMQHAETKEKVSLPGQQDIAAEKGQQALRAGIEGFDSAALKKTETCEKNPLPTKETIAQEKAA